MHRVVRRAAVVRFTCIGLAAPLPATAQQRASIVGQVLDPTGAVGEGL